MAEKTYITGNFFNQALELRDGPKWGMSLKAAGSMRFRWSEVNPNRNSFLNVMRGGHQLCQVELIHSRIVMAVDSPAELEGVRADGIITRNKNLFPVITVADCMPIFLFEPESQVFGVLHSGWKGTGIVKDALLLAKEKYGSDPGKFSIVMGPHIHQCCYSVDEERAKYFIENFTPDCVHKGRGNQLRFKNKEQALNGMDTLSSRKINDEECMSLGYSLSLAKANLAVLAEMGVPENNIAVSNDCTCCNPIFGSFRRQNPVEGTFTVQAAWVSW